ncbi:MAG: amidohydrolase family protein [Chitinophagales bacterium]|nr:amidohydrolase family protein [Chitinophagales bacterium]
MHKFTADLIYPVSSEPLERAVVITDDSGKILVIESLDQHDPASVRHVSGVLVPGFVNTHCHLELSHMKGKVDTGTGLIPFITGVVTKRNAAQEEIQDAIQRAEQEMLDGGIVALGDISNAPDTFAVKSRGRMRYHTFLEMFDFLQEENAEKTFSDGLKVFEQLRHAPGSTATLVPHAPYSVSKNLFQKINASNPGTGITVSIHNQETPPEQELFLEKKGGFLDFYGKFGISMDAFESTGQPSIYYALAHMNPAVRTLFVHNTLTTQQDIMAAQAWSDQVYWATCPNANLYIENRLPDYAAFLNTGARLTIGTDSLTSNWQLSVLEEMKTITRYQSYVPFDALLRWATLNGAQALGFDDTLGSIEPGKTPGLLQLQGLEGGKLDAKATIHRLT